MGFTAVLVHEMPGNPRGERMVNKRPSTWTDQKVERSEEEMNEDKRIVPDARTPLLMLCLQM